MDDEVEAAEQITGELYVDFIAARVSSAVTHCGCAVRPRLQRVLTCKLRS